MTRQLGHPAPLAGASRGLEENKHCTDKTSSKDLCGSFLTILRAVLKLMECTAPMRHLKKRKG